MTPLLKPAAAATLAILSGTGVPTAAQPGTSGTALTIYSSAAPGAVSPELMRAPSRGALPGYGVVRQERNLEFTKGRNAVRFSDVAALIDPTTVVFESLTDAKGTTVLEQNYQFDLVSTEKLLQKYVDRPITVDQVRGQGTESFSGTLLSTQGGMVLKRDDGSVQILPHNAGVRLPSLPGGLITRPTLVWDLNAQRAGTHRTRVSYQTQGMTWWADYNVTYAEGAHANACSLDIGAWVSIVNQSGASYGDARLKLVAGEVHRATSAAPYPQSVAKGLAARESVADGFAEKSFFEYHLYTLGRATTLPDNSTKQIELFPVARRVPCERVLVYYGAPMGHRGFLPSPATDRNYGVQGNRKVDVYLQFRNSDANNMGMPLPAGRMRVSKLDPADQTLEFVGEDSIEHTPRNEQVQLQLGSAFDVVGERRQVDFRVDTSRRTMTEDIEVRLRNQKKERVQVQVKENLYRWVNWNIASRSHDFRKEDARTIVFPVTVAPEAEVVVRYTVQYTW
ncbi:MAG: hypothetical protein OEW34_05345 [Burkholderiaceae bacterium]|jgi:hypothetical protein|nr:hypothetical protein [Burkholderiaceae bacterium]